MAVESIHSRNVGGLEGFAPAGRRIGTNHSQAVAYADALLVEMEVRGLRVHSSISTCHWPVPAHVDGGRVGSDTRLPHAARVISTK